MHMNWAYKTRINIVIITLFYIHCTRGFA